FLLGAALVCVPGGCTDEGPGTPEASPVDVGGAQPQDGAPPTGSPDADQAPQIVSLHGPDSVRPGQIVTIQLTTDFDPVEEVSHVAVVVAQQPGWSRVAVSPVATAGAGAGRYLVSVELSILLDAVEGDTIDLEFALMRGEVAGVYRSHRLTIVGGALQCPADADCGPQVCGVDPRCATVCGSCDATDVCSIDGQCVAGDGDGDGDG